ncbi:MAG: hypothetical protein AB1345_09875 [Chloroflexota bacterium]
MLTSTHPTYPTLYPEINAVLHSLLSSAQVVLGVYFTGMYLCGSLAIGDFDPQRSDVDFLAVNAGELPDKMFQALKTMRAHKGQRFEMGDEIGRRLHT